ncbi:MAG: hypothetical protein AB1726_02620 [Planctomycetota bacterium]
MKTLDILTAGAIAGALALSVSLAGAQSQYGFAAGGLVVEGAGPPAGACGYPNGPLLSAFPVVVPFGCPLPTPPAPPPMILGDIAVDKVADTAWATDGFICGEYIASGPALGTPITGFVPLPFGAGGPITGLGYDSAAGFLWMTEGIFAQALIPPAPPGCPGVGVVAIAAFPLPLFAGAMATDIDWDPVTGTLWICDTLGLVTNVLIGGAIGPFGFFAAAPGPCGLAVPLEGLAIDPVGSTVFGIPTMYVTDGFTIAYEMLGGAPGPPTFYTPAPCFPALGPLVGLAFADRALSYGTGADNSGLAPPTIGSTGQTLSPSGTFTVTLAGSVPGSTAVLYMSTSGFYCPPPVVLGLPIYIDLSTPVSLLGVVPVGAAGTASLATGIPPGLPPGVTAWLQWLAVTPTPSLQVSEGLEVIVDLP